MAGNYLTLRILGQDVSAGTTLDSVGKKVDATATKISRVGDNLSKIGGKLTLGVTLPLVGIAAAGVKTEKDFSRSMAQIGVATGAGSTEMQKLSGYASKMGADTVFSSGQAADAMLNLAKGGFTPAQITGGALASTMALAAAGNMDLAEAANVTVAAMNTFGLSAKNSASIADALAGGANASSADVADLALALSQAGSAARTSHQSLNDTVGVLAALADQGVKGSDAGTALKTFLTRLVPQTQAASKAMDALGISFVNADGSIKKLPEVAGILQTKLAGLTDAQRQTALQTIFGTDAFRVASALYTTGSAGIEKYVAATKKRGNAQQMADAQMSGSAGAIEQMTGSLETAALSIGQALAPAVTDLANRIAGLANWFSSLDPETQKLIITLAGIAAAAGPTLKVIGSLTSGVSTGVKVYKSAADAAGRFADGYRSAGAAASSFSGRMGSIGGKVSKAVTGIKSLGLTTKIATAAQWLFNAAMNANPIMLIATAIAALVAGLVWFFTQTKLGRQIWEGFTQALGTAWNWLWNSILKPGFDALGAIFTWLWNTIIKPVVDFIVADFKILGAIFQVIWVYALQPMLKLLGDAFTWLWQNAIKPAIDQIGAVISWLWTTIIQPVVNFIVGYVQQMAAVFTWLWVNIIQPVFNMIGQIFSWIWTTIIKPVVDFIVGYVQQMAAVFSWLWVNIIKPVFDAIGGIINWIWTNIIRPVFGVIGGAVHVLGQAFHDVFSTLGDFIGSVFKGAAKVVEGGINTIIDIVNHAIDVINGLGQLASNVTGGSVKWHLDKLPKVHFLAEGAIATAATLAVIGEGSEPEAVMPLSKLQTLLDDNRGAAPDRGGRGGNLHVTFQMSDRATPAELMRELLWAATKAGFRFEGTPT